MLCRGDRRSPSFLSPLVATGYAQTRMPVVLEPLGTRVWSNGRTAVRSYSGTMITEVSDFVPCHLIGVLERGFGRKSRETRDKNSPPKISFLDFYSALQAQR